MSRDAAKRMLAELLALHTATRRTDAKLRGAAERISAHHHERAAAIRQRIPAPGARDDDLESDYLDSVYEANIADRY